MIHASMIGCSIHVFHCSEHEKCQYLMHHIVRAMSTVGIQKILGMYRRLNFGFHLDPPNFISDLVVLPYQNNDSAAPFVPMI